MIGLLGFGVLILRDANISGSIENCRAPMMIAHSGKYGFGLNESFSRFVVF